MDQPTITQNQKDNYVYGIIYFLKINLYMFYGMLVKTVRMRMELT